MLAASGAPVLSAKPSTSLSSLIDNHYSLLLTATSKLAPGVLPGPSSHFTDIFRPYFQLMLMFSALTVFLVLCFAPQFVYLALFEIILTAIVAIKLADKHIKENFSSKYYLPEINTFGDLSRMITDHRAKLHG
jgi:hypothetical protein